MKFIFGWKLRKRSLVMEPEDLLSKLKELRPNIDISDIKKMILNGEEYLKAYPDIKAAGICPVEHYFNYGEKEGRTFYPPTDLDYVSYPTLINGGSVFYANTPSNNGIYIYRILFRTFNEQDAIIIPHDANIKQFIIAAFSANKCVFIRSNNDSKTNFLLQLCKTLGVKIIYDIDDLLLPEYTYMLGGVRSGKDKLSSLLPILVKDSALLPKAAELTCSTKGIALAYDKLCAKITITPNKLPSKYFKKQSEIENKKKGQTHSHLKILYFSGTNTHFKDYSLISGVLLKLSQEYSGKFSLSFMGEVNDQSRIFKSLGVNFTQLPYVPFEDMLNVIFQYDIVLVPLEKNAFNDAKSCIKYLEAASQGVPVMASNAEEFSNTIEHGIDGWICHNVQDWYNELSYLIQNPQMTIKAGIKANQKAVARYSL
ncbi:glycosyltransferase family 1 protein [Erwinia billingiae]|nr:glycosyltransferase family 1 protein [Erwinia billingiae]